jgi:hypothetical protein
MTAVMSEHPDNSSCETRRRTVVLRQLLRQHRRVSPRPQAVGGSIQAMSDRRQDLAALERATLRAVRRKLHDRLSALPEQVTAEAVGDPDVIAAAMVSAIPLDHLPAPRRRGRVIPQPRHPVSKDLPGAPPAINGIEQLQELKRSRHRAL